MLAAKLLEVDNRYFIAVGIYESFPNFDERVARRAGDRIQIESIVPIRAPRLVNPFLLGGQQFRPIYELQNRELKTRLSILIPSLLQVNISVLPPAQSAHVVFPACPKVNRAADIKLACGCADNLIYTGRM